ncbi:MAG: proline--tRNA ligase [Patescibacteria group bacterium]|nr:proline--tRNA ligase [Patescibacteria group bacterium]
MANKQVEKNSITKKSENVSDWYADVIIQSGLADYGPVRGTMILKPYGYALWENVQKALDAMFKSGGVENAYFPMFIPMSLFNKEKSHIEGFSPELAVVTIGGGEQLSEPLAVRPTSEMIMYQEYAKWIHSWRDLPVKINQWNNVVRWEKRTYLFLRTLEFLWQEGHCAHATHEESLEMVLRALDWYRQIYEDFYAIPVVLGVKSQSEKFAGADSTYTVEAIMPDGKALQACTSHDLGQNFSKALSISFQDKNGVSQYVWQNSWGFSTRSLGALFLTHGDDSGLVLPPKVAPIKVAIIPIFGKKDDQVLKYCEKIKQTLTNSPSAYPGRIEIFDDSEKSFGWRVNEAELKGIPIKIAVGIREVQEKAISYSFRLFAMDNKISKFEDLPEKVEQFLSQIQNQMFENAKTILRANTHLVDNYEEFKERMLAGKGFLRAFWCEDVGCEQKIKEETKATTRCRSLDEKEDIGKCVYCGKSAKFRWYFAQAY